MNKRIITVVTGEYYIRQALRLYASVKKTNPNLLFTVFTNDTAPFSHIQDENFEAAHFEAINTLGVKRAKFAVYQYASENYGSFLFLDSDIIVLGDLSELFQGTQLSGCLDHLKDVRQIGNKKYPWAGDPQLENKRYINAGVVYFPVEQQAFLKQIHEYSLDDDTWERYVLRGILHDNHFLCAMINLHNIKVNELNPTEYNYQGFYQGNALQVELVNNTLKSIHEKSVALKLIHFAGIDDPDAFIRKLDPEIRSYIRSFLDKNICINDPLLSEEGAPDTPPTTQDPTKNIVLDSPRVTLSSCHSSIPFKPGFCTKFRIQIENHSTQSLSSSFTNPVYVSYHFMSQGMSVIYDGIRSALPRVLGPGESCECDVTVKFPEQYTEKMVLEFDLVQEGVLWFSVASASNLLSLPVLSSGPQTKDLLPVFVDDSFRECWLQNNDKTMVPWSVAYTAFLAAEYVGKHKIPGDVVECGVWRGGCSILMGTGLAKTGCIDKKIYMYDTYQGMTEPKDADFITNVPTITAKEIYSQKERNGDVVDYAYCSLDDVKANMKSSPYPFTNHVFIQGKVEDTIPVQIPEQIALLRLDTDWYESTIHELLYLFPRLTPGGIFICDDYSWWAGAQKAVDEYFLNNSIRMFFSVDPHSGAIVGVKQSAHSVASK